MNSKPKKKRIAIIGAGPAGLSCAITALKKGIEVVVFERNEVAGKKILLTGNGHCNITNLNIKDINQENISDYYHTDDEARLLTLLKNSYDKVYELLEDCCIVPLNKGQLVYPRSYQASSVRDALTKRVLVLGGEIRTGIKVTGIENGYDSSGNESVRLILGQEDGSMDYESFHACVLCTGSRSFPDTGSDGFGYKLLKKLSIPFRKPMAALTKFYSQDRILEFLAGVRWKGKLSFVLGDIHSLPLKISEGEIQFLKNAVSGIVAFDLSYLYREAVERDTTAYLCVDFVPEMDSDVLSDYLLSLNKKYPYLSIMERLCGCFNNKIVEAILYKCGIACTQIEINESEIFKLVKTLKKLVIEISGTGGFNECQVCSGGIGLKSLDESLQATMQPGIYFAGEIIDVDGICGGYNIHFALATGIEAGNGISKNLEDI